MAHDTTRPVALTVLPENIPAELKALFSWVCWRYEWNEKRRKWTKVPYTPFTTTKAAVNRPSSWRSFEAAYKCYLERRDFFDGVFICLTADDPYAGGDFDHNTSIERVPATYAELSPSGEGIRFIGRGLLPSACKKAEGELYDRRRFLSVTGHRLEGKPATTRPIQAELDALYEELGGGEKATREGAAGGGSRAARAAAIPEDEWERGRHERRENINRLLARLRSSAVSKKTRKDDTQLGYLLREDYQGFHDRWGYVGIIRSDNTIDNSQVRAVMASSIKMRGFTFPQFVALMSYFFGAECAAKWGTKQGVREELATLWFLGRSPRANEYVQDAVEPAPRGRAGNHGELLEQAYDTLLSFKAGTDAILTIADLAEALGVHRRTASGLLAELESGGRITYQQAGQYAGILVSFPGMLYSPVKSAGIEHQEHTNGHRPYDAVIAESGIDHTSGVIYSENVKREIPQDSAENEAEDAAPIIADTAPYIDHDLYTHPVYLPGASIIPEKRVSLEQVVRAAYEDLPRDRLVDTRTGERKKWPVTVGRVIDEVERLYPGRWKPDAIAYWAQRVRGRRKNERFDDLRRMRRAELDARLYAVARRIEAARREGEQGATPEIREYFKKQTAKLESYRSLLLWEQSQRDAREAERFEQQGYSLSEQQEMLDLVEKHRGPTTTPAGLISRLKARRISE